jgi:RHS repeat-associated protein
MNAPFENRNDDQQQASKEGAGPEFSKNAQNSVAETKSNGIQIPSISLPKGGGALKSIDEKFSVNAANGTATLSVPLPITPSRNGFQPALALTYNSGLGNSAFGLGWNIDHLSIQLKIDKKIPRYSEEDEDVFMISGMEDLVPCLLEIDGSWRIKFSDADKRVKCYRPRIEGAFSRIEKITHDLHGTYWKVTTKENITIIFGRSKECRIASPHEDTKIFKWLPEFSFDDKGNWVSYDYKEDSNNTPQRRAEIPNDLHELNRKNGNSLFVNRYLKTVKYGNHVPYYPDAAQPFDPSAVEDTGHFFELVFDYGEHDSDVPEITESANLKWGYREDAHSDYRMAFEVRTARLCKRVLMFHSFSELGATPCLVRALNLTYQASSINNSGQAEVTYLQSITQTGYLRKPDNSYSQKSLPPLEFEYQHLQWNKEIRKVSKDNIFDAPVGLSNNYQWTDFFGEGISGILTEQAEGWYYKNNLGDPGEDGNVQFAAAKIIAPRPSFSGLNTGVLQLQDLDANGEKQMVVDAPGLKGYFQLTGDNEWQPFKAFLHAANIDLRDNNVRAIDLNGDGMPDLVVSEDNVFLWYPSEGKNGYAAAETCLKSFEEEKGPAIVFADRLQTIFLADMCGDGLTDIVRIRNGEACYWANLGYGHFSAKVNMSNAPKFKYPEQFNAEYLHLADISGTGATDLIYTGQNSCIAHLNLAGNGWSKGYEIETVPAVYHKNQLAVIDLLGTGTSCITWSSELPGDAHAPMRYIDLMSSKKPHVMVKQINNFGKETTIQYKCSTYYYLRDKAAGKPWITKLPFPVQVVSKTVTEEKITAIKFSIEYQYHHGYYHHCEKEFRGFGMVEHTDTEEYETWKLNNAGTKLDNSAPLFQKPVLTKTWFHTGAFLEKEKILSQFETEYWYNELNRFDRTAHLTEPALPDAKIVAAKTILDRKLIDNISTAEWDEALRCCKGMVLREEIFAVDAPVTGATDKELKLQLTPYSVSTHNCNVQLLQPRASNNHAVFVVTENEALAFHYERNTADPRIAHTLHTDIDETGNILESVSVVYGRFPQEAKETFNLIRNGASDFEGDQQAISAFEKHLNFVEAEQQKTLVTFTKNDFTSDNITDSIYRLRLIAETKTYELTGFTKTGVLFSLTDFDDAIRTASSEIRYDQTPDFNFRQRRLIENIRTIYYDVNLNKPLEFKKHASHGLLFENYQLAYTPALLTAVFADHIADPDVALATGKYTKIDGTNWWIPSGRILYHSAGDDLKKVQDRFFSPLSYIDPFGSETKVSYYKDYALMVQSVTDQLENVTSAEGYDFRTLVPVKIRDINNNLSGVLFDELGLVKASALFGKDLDGDGIAELEIADDLNGMEAFFENEHTDIDALFQTEDSNQLETTGRKLLKNATSRFLYDFDVYRKSAGPTVACTINREEHHTANSKLQISFAFSHGLGAIAMAKVPAEPGMAKKATVQPDGSFNVEDVNLAALNPVRLRWVGSGRTVLNNKGNPVKKYEPYFSVTPFYENAKELVETGVTPTIYYDAIGRNIMTALPDGSTTKVIFDGWKQLSYDQNDTVNDPDSTWLKNFEGINNPALNEAAAQARKHAETPSQSHFDSLGRPIFSINHNGTDNNGKANYLATSIELDIEGNSRSIMDARGNQVMKYHYDMLGHNAYQNSMDAGERWMLNDCMGKPIMSWDSKDQQFETSYDLLHRPLELRVTKLSTGLSLVFEKHEYIDTKGLSAAKLKAQQTLNLVGKAVTHYDTAGIGRMIRCDFKGNMLENSRQLCLNFKIAPDWTTPLSIAMETEEFVSLTTFDALNRPRSIITPHTVDFQASVIIPGYNTASLLEKIDVQLHGSNVSTPFVTNINYNEKGQREEIFYGNNSKTKYSYDKETFRLKRLFTTRSNGIALQDLTYTYDPVGNITQIQDAAQANIFFNNEQVKAFNQYEYDPLYRLVHATGREHAGQNVLDNSRPVDFKYGNFPFKSNAAANDASAFRNYTEAYRYDSVGNVLEQNHTANGNNWSRTFEYTKPNNQLTKTEVGTFSFDYKTHYDEHGNMTMMEQLKEMVWNIKDELSMVDLDGGGKAYYTYGSGGQRMRKVIVRNDNSKLDRIYLGGFEIYREHDPSGLITLQRESLHVVDDKKRVALLETKTVGTNPGSLTRYQYDNHLSSACYELDDAPNAKVISYEEYFPYGTTSYYTVDASREVPTKRYRYTEKERDEESGLSYHGMRYYVPWLARWSSCDSVFHINLFVYCACNPINLCDPDGKDEHPNEMHNAQVTGQETQEQVHKMYAAQNIFFKGNASWVKTEGGGYWYLESWQVRARETGTKLNMRADVIEGKKTAKAAAAKPTGPTPQQKIQEKRQQDWDAAAAGMWDTALDIAFSSVVHELLVEPLKSGPPKATGDYARDQELKENYEGGGLVTNTIVAGVSMLPVAEIAEAAQLAASKAPALVGAGSGGAGELVSFSEQWAAGGAKAARASSGSGRSTVVYQLVDEQGSQVYVGISKDYRAVTRLEEHASKFGQNFRGMQVISEPLLEQEAKLLETTLIRENKPILNTLESSITPPITGLYVPEQIKPLTTMLNPMAYGW